MLADIHPFLFPLERDIRLGLFVCGIQLRRVETLLLGFSLAGFIDRFEKLQLRVGLVLLIGQVKLVFEVFQQRRHLYYLFGTLVFYLLFGFQHLIARFPNNLRFQPPVLHLKIGQFVEILLLQGQTGFELFLFQGQYSDIILFFRYLLVGQLFGKLQFQLTVAFLFLRQSICPFRLYIIDLRPVYPVIDVNAFRFRIRYLSGDRISFFRVFLPLVIHREDFQFLVKKLPFGLKVLQVILLVREIFLFPVLFDRQEACLVRIVIGRYICRHGVGSFRGFLLLHTQTLKPLYLPIDSRYFSVLGRYFRFGSLRHLLGKFQQILLYLDERFTFLLKNGTTVSTSGLCRFFRKERRQLIFYFLYFLGCGIYLLHIILYLSAKP